MVEAPLTSSGETLPVDVLLDIVRRSDDVATVVRCAAAFKLLRRGILNPGFYHRLQVRPDPAFLVGVSYASYEYGVGKLDPSRRLRLDPAILRYMYRPVSSRDGLLVLRGPESVRDLHVCNTFTGLITSLPCSDVEAGDRDRSWYYSPAVLEVGRAGRCFEVLVMDMRLRTLIFSSEDGKWGAVREAEAPPEYKDWRCIKELVLHNSPAIIGCTVHWICYGKRGPGVEDMFIFAVHAAADATTQTATSVAMPPCYPFIDSVDMKTCTVQIAAIDGKLGVVAAEIGVISVWTYSSPEGWTRKAAICKRGIRKQVCGERLAPAVRFEGFGERSGTALFWMESVGLVRLDLETEKAVCVRGSIRDDPRAVKVARSWLHEINLGSLLSGMKKF